MSIRTNLCLLATAILSSATLSCSDHSDPVSEKDVLEYVASAPKPMQARESLVKANLHDLLISWIDLPNWEGRGGALATSNNLLWLISPTGQLLWADLLKLNGPYSTKIKVPTNRDNLISSGYSKEINLEWFRVAGAYAERTESGVSLFVAHHVFDKQCIFLQVSRIDLTFDVESGFSEERRWRNIFRPDPCIRIGDASFKPFAGHQVGGKIVSLDKNHILVSYGDHEIDGVQSPQSSQDPNSPYGKIWRISKDGGSSNVYAIGVRNPQGLYFERENREVWESEHGPQGGDELNLIVKNKNYGWPIETYGVMYGDYEWPLNAVQGSHCSANYEPPVFAWVPSIGVSNLTKINGPKFPLWTGDLLLATLKDKSIHRLRIRGKRVVYDERIELGQRVRDILALDDGKVAIISDTGLLGLIDDPGPKLKPIPQDWFK